ncbi:restriction endonuclease subunit S [Dapis sp. BLCC M172]|uniref:restriction endonuclease subunit S n=1 Tax=Dapis sp. BLCC M172 TaxID=2975281 RepID=UPI003CF5D91F
MNLAKDYLLSEGDIIFARSGATVGKTFQFKDYSGLACFAGYLIKAIPKESIILSDYLYLFTKSEVYDIWKTSIFIQATIQNIGADKYSCLSVSLPPISEQTEIVSFIETKSEKIERSLATIEKEIKLIQEYRTTLISETVTGKIDVRKYRPSNQKSKTFSE